MAVLAGIWTDNASGNILINDQGNWNDGASGYPDANDDTATFNGTWTSNATVNVSWTVGEITTTSAYTGTITQAAATVIDDAGAENGNFTIGANNTWDVSTYDITVDGAAAITGVFKMGTTGATGATFNGTFTTSAANTLDLQTDSIIIFHGDIVLNDDSMVNVNRGEVYIGTSCNIDTSDTGEGFYFMTVNAGQTLAFTGSGAGKLTHADGNGFNLIGILDIAVNKNCAIGCGATGSLTIGNAADINSSQAGAKLLLQITDGATITNNRASAFGINEDVEFNHNKSGSMLILAWNFSNADIIIQFNGTNKTFITTAGTLKGKNLSLNTGTTGHIITNSANNPSFTFTESVNLKVSTQTLTTYTKGTGTWTLAEDTVGSTKTFNFEGFTIEDIVVNTGTAGDTKQLTNHVTTDSLTLTQGTFDIQTYNCTSSGLTNVTAGGILTIGTSSGTGLTTAGLTANDTSALSMQTGSIINNSGNCTLASDATINPLYRGTYTQTGDGNYSAPHRSIWWSFTVDATKTLTLTGSTTWLWSVSMVLNGAIAVGAATDDYVYAEDTLTLGANSDFTGSGTLNLVTKNTVTFTNSKSGAFSLTGIANMALGKPTTSGAITGDFSNADYQISGTTVAKEIVFLAGTQKSKKFTITNANNFGVTVTNSTNSPSYIWTDDVDFNAGAGSYTTVWTKGTGSITLTTGDATTKTIDFNNQSIEDLIINSTDDSDIKQLVTGSVTTDSLTITDGVFDINFKTCTSSGATSVTGTLKINTGTLTTAGLTFNAGSGADLQTSSNVNNSGAYSCNNSAIWSNNNRGAYTQTASANYSSPSTSNYWYDFTINTGVTLTCTGNAQISDESSNDFTMGNNSVLACGIYIVSIGGTGTVTFGTGIDISGTNSLRPAFTGATITDNFAGTYSFSGELSYFAKSGLVMQIICNDFSNADILVKDQIGGAEDDFIFTSGTLKIKDFKIDNDNATATRFDANTNNPNYEISGDIDFKVDNSIAWTAGTGLITLTGSSGTQTINFDGQTIEPLIINAAGATKTFSGNVTTPTVTFTAGSVNLNSQTLTTGGHVTLTSTVTFSQSGTIEVTGNTVFDLDSTDQSIMSVDVAAGAIIAFQSGAISGKDLTVDGTANFSTADNDTVFENISGAGTINSTLGDLKYLFYTGSNNFTGTLNNVIIAEYGSVGGRINTSPNINNQLRVRP